MFSYTEFQINTDYITISATILEYGALHQTDIFPTIEMCDHYHQRWLQNTIEDNNDILSTNNAKIIHSKLGSMSFRVPDTTQLLQCILYSNYVPSELRKIINDYYGEDGPIENLLYSLLAKLVYELKTNVFTKYLLPYADHTPKNFTLWLKYIFPISIRYIYRPLCLPLDNEPTVSPALFYKFYKEVNELGDDFIPPLFDKNKPPSLSPLRRPSSSYELSTEYPDD